MVTSTKTRLTGERPQQGVTPDSLLALHEAGYRAVLDRIGQGRILDVGCGQGFESARFLAPRAARSSGSTTPPRPRPRPRPATAPRASGWRRWTPWTSAFLTGSFDGACSSHLIEHFTDPEPHVAELARVLKDDGVGCVLTPNKPADFENPFHLHLFERDELRSMLERHFDDVWLGGVDAAPHVKADFAARRVKANKLLRLDVFDLRHRIPHAWYVWPRTPACCRWPTSWWPGRTPVARPGSPPTTGSSPTTWTTRRSSSSRWSGPRAGPPLG